MDNIAISFCFLGKARGDVSMNLKIQLLWAFMISVVSLIGFSLMAIVISRHDILSFDSTIISYVQGLRDAYLNCYYEIFYVYWICECYFCDYGNRDVFSI